MRKMGIMSCLYIRTISFNDIYHIVINEVCFFENFNGKLYRFCFFTLLFYSRIASEFDPVYAQSFAKLNMNFRHATIQDPTEKFEPIIFTFVKYTKSTSFLASLKLNTISRWSWRILNAWHIFKICLIAIVFNKFCLPAVAIELASN